MGSMKVDKALRRRFEPLVEVHALNRYQHKDMAEQTTVKKGAWAITSGLPTIRWVCAKSGCGAQKPRPKGTSL